MLTALQLIRLRIDGRITRELDVLERQIRHLTRLVEDLLDVSRITRKAITLERRPIAVADVLAKAIEMVGPLFEKRAQELSFESPSPTLMVYADPDRLAQVFSNLLTNASTLPLGGRSASSWTQRTPRSRYESVTRAKALRRLSFQGCSIRFRKDPARSTALREDWGLVWQSYATWSSFMEARSVRIAREQGAEASS
jgi:hypothetical protein